VLAELAGTIVLPAVVVDTGAAVVADTVAAVVAGAGAAVVADTVVVAAGMSVAVVGMLAGDKLVVVAD